MINLNSYNNTCMFDWRLKPQYCTRDLSNCFTDLEATPWCAYIYSQNSAWLWGEKRCEKDTCFPSKWRLTSSITNTQMPSSWIILILCDSLSGFPLTHQVTGGMGSPKHCFDMIMSSAANLSLFASVGTIVFELRLVNRQESWSEFALHFCGWLCKNSARLANHS